MQDMAGKYVSHAWIRKNVMQQSDDDIEKQDAYINAENQSGDPRWLNPLVMQNEQMIQQEQQAQQPQSDQEPMDDESRDKLEQVRQAMVTIDQMKQKGVQNRTTQEQSAYKAAVQLVAKNPDIVQRLGAVQ
jgi:hypothetical protein